MYLSTKQHDQLQIIVTSFEIPYRSYIIREILNSYNTNEEFTSVIGSISSINSKKDIYNIVNSELGKIKKNPSQYYNLIKSSADAHNNGIVEKEISVPNVSTLIAFTIIFRQLFKPLLDKFIDEDAFLTQAASYKYVRNKLDHRGTKTLDIQDKTISLEFVSNCLLFLGADETLFWDKSYSDITKEVTALQTSSITIPLEIHNIPDMPFSDTKIVCRDKEIREIKEFVYGPPGALRKQVSFILFGYGGVGKTALVLEAVKQIIQDIQDNTTINSYNPDFILFFSAKEETLDISSTTGKISSIKNKCTFQTADELESNIYQNLKITSFSSYSKCGLIIIDNLETLKEDERIKIEQFIRFKSPQQIQYIITSRNEENYEYRKKLAGFDDDISGHEFINKYIEENNLTLVLSDDDVKTLLQISMGNTLVLVLSLRRLGLNVESIGGILSDMTSPATIKKIKNEIQKIPPNGFSIISEYMFKNTFQEILNNYSLYGDILSVILKIFAVYPGDSIDLYTISILSKKPYSDVDPILDLLCKYLIVEKVNENYRLNQFAEKYIIQLFMPNTEEYERISTEIALSTKQIQDELNRLQTDINKNKALRDIIRDWNVVSDGDKIAVAKAYTIFGEVSRDCRNYSSQFHISSSLQEALVAIEQLEQNTMHPYIKFQKARILRTVSETKVLNDDLSVKIKEAFNDTIWTIKANSIYSSIKGTRSYASVLWMYGIHLALDDTNYGYQNAIRYLEESIIVFKSINDTSTEYYQCLILLGSTYLNLYNIDNEKNMSYLRKSRKISDELYKSRHNYSNSSKVKRNATELRDKIRLCGEY